MFEDFLGCMDGRCVLDTDHHRLLVKQYKTHSFCEALQGKCQLGALLSHLKALSRQRVVAAMSMSNNPISRSRPVSA